MEMMRKVHLIPLTRRPEAEVVRVACFFTLSSFTCLLLWPPMLSFFYPFFLFQRRKRKIMRREERKKKETGMRVLTLDFRWERCGKKDSKLQWSLSLV